MGIKGRKIEWNEKVGELEDWGKMLDGKKKVGGWKLVLDVKMMKKMLWERKLRSEKWEKNWGEKIIEEKRGIEIEN